MDIHLHDARPSDEERAAVAAVLGPPASGWQGAPRTSGPEANTAVGGRSQRERRHLLLPALQALQARVGWVSDGGMRLVCEQLGVPPAEAWSVATFYALLATTPRPRRVVHVCDDIRCRAHGAAELCQRLADECGPEPAHRHGGEPPAACWMRSPCLGLCDHGPAALLTEAGDPPIERLLGPVTAESVRALLAGGDVEPDAAACFALPQRGEAGLVLLRRVGVADPSSLDAYVAAGGYQALPRALAMGPEAVIAEVETAKLVGRGGAAFPAARKWAAVRAQAVTPRHLVCNADESEPGTFKDRVLLTGDPFAVVESMTIAAFAAGCGKGWLYVRAEYPLAHERMAAAVAAARRAGWLGERIGGSAFSFDIELRRGAGAYVCGEETALFESIAGQRGEPGTKPPFPVEAGLFGRPTVVNNVETLVNVLPIVLEGGAVYARRGTPGSTGTRLFCVSGSVRQGGVYEVPLGTPLRALIERAGGVAPGRSIAAVLLGGAAGTFVRPDELDLPLTLEDARAAGATLGSGVVMVFDDTVDLHDVLRRIAAFFRDESCGQCVPCRVGTVRQEEALHRLASGRPLGSVRDELQLLADVGAGMRDASICGLGQAAHAAVESAVHRLKLFGEPPARPGPTPPAAAVEIPAAPPGRVALTIDGERVEVAAGTTLLAACRQAGIEVPTLCFHETLAPINACRLCVVEVAGARVLVPGCSRLAEPGMAVETRSARVVAARRMVLEMLASSVDLSTAPGLQALCAEYGVRAGRYGPPSPPADRDRALAGHHARPAAALAASVAQPAKVDNELYVRDYAKCVLCYRCVRACGEEHQNTFAIGVAGRGFDARISTEADVPLGESACVYCGNCVAVCPTGALMAKTEYDLRAAGEWDPSRQTVTLTICPYCGVGCTLSLHVQDGRIVKALSPPGNAITHGNLCVKGRFGWTFVRPQEPCTP
jgi:NADH-quinone oxidoreductase subunit F